MAAAIRVVFCTYPSVYSQIVLQQLCEASHIDVVGIVASERVLNPRYGFLRGAFAQLMRSGLFYTGYLFAISNVLPVLSAAPGIGPSARKRGIPLICTRDVNAADARGFVEDCAADVLLCANFNQLVGPDLLNHPHRIALNIHPGQLPQYRGVDPVFFALLDGAPELSVTVHLMAGSFDTGSILATAATDAHERSLLLSTAELFRLGARDLVNLLHSNPAELPNRAIGQKGSPRYDSWPNADHVRTFRKLGYRLLGGWQALRRNYLAQVQVPE